MITLKAMAKGKPIVATRIDGFMNQNIDNRSATLVPPRAPLELAPALLQLVGNPERSKNIGVNARKRAQTDFSVETMVKGYHCALRIHYIASWLYTTD